MKSFQEIEITIKVRIAVPKTDAIGQYDKIGTEVVYTALCSHWDGYGVGVLVVDSQAKEVL